MFKLVLGNRTLCIWRFFLTIVLKSYWTVMNQTMTSVYRYNPIKLCSHYRGKVFCVLPCMMSKLKHSKPHIKGTQNTNMFWTCVIQESNKLFSTEHWFMSDISQGHSVEKKTAPLKWMPKICAKPLFCDNVNAASEHWASLKDVFRPSLCYLAFKTLVSFPDTGFLLLRQTDVYLFVSFVIHWACFCVFLVSTLIGMCIVRILLKLILIPVAYQYQYLLIYFLILLYNLAQKYVGAVPLLYPTDLI